LVILLLLAGYWSIRIAGADLEARSASFGGVAQAIRLAAGNADYRVLLADLLEAQGRDSRGLLESAVALNPNDAQVLIRLGLETEMRSDEGRAERYFLEAARVSAQYQPRWTLANYYYRHSNRAAFWYWVRNALAKSYGDRRPLFRLCWNMSADSSTILKNALPEQGVVWRDYLRYLVGEGRLDAAQPVAMAILDRLQPSDVRLLVDYDDALLHAGFWQPALTVWNRLCASTLLRHAALTPSEV
jgi:tetratricopeptide (TPR) repeat protein